MGTPLEHDGLEGAVKHTRAAELCVAKRVCNHVYNSTRCESAGSYNVSLRAEEEYQGIRERVKNGLEEGDQDRTGGGLVCISMRLTVSSPKGEPPSLQSKTQSLQVLKQR